MDDETKKLASAPGVCFDSVQLDVRSQLVVRDCQRIITKLVTDLVRTICDEQAERYFKIACAQYRTDFERSVEAHHQKVTDAALASVDNIKIEVVNLRTHLGSSHDDDDY